jgi:predicted secreted acid phosphatase
MTKKEKIHVLPLVVLVSLFVVAALVIGIGMTSQSFYPGAVSDLATTSSNGTVCTMPLGRNYDRCKDIGGDNVENSTQYKDTTSGKTVYGCKGNEGSGGGVSLCSGTTYDGCKKNPTSEDIDKLKKYYGTSSDGEVDTTTQYYTDVRNIMMKATQQIQKMVDSGYFRCLKKNGVTPAVMFDQDDTIWSTWYEDNQAKFKYDGTLFNRIANKNYMPTITPVVTFIKYLNSVGAKPIFVTGRPATGTVKLEDGTTVSLVDITSRQLSAIPLKKGTDYWGGNDVGDGNEVQSKNGVFMHSAADTRTGKGSNASVYKETTRCWIENNPDKMGGNYKFVMSVGDQWSDSNGNCAGVRVKLPNAMYYLP